MVEQVFRELNKRNIIYAVLRNAEGLPYEHGRDVDLLVELKDKDRLLQLFSSLENSIRFRILTRRHKYIKLILSTEQEMIQIDLFFGETFVGLEYFALEESSIIEHNEVKKLDKKSQVASLLLAFSIRGYTKQRYVNLISKYIRDSKNSDALYKSLDSRISKRRLKKLFDAIEKGENKLSRKNVIINRTNFIFSSLVKSGAILGFVLYLVSRIRELTKAKGMLIVFVGPDGSGKSTVIEKLSNEIVPELATSVKYYHDKFELLPSLSRLRGQKVLNDRSTQTGALRKYSVKRKLLYIAYYSVDYFLGRIVVGYNKMKGGYIIFDRYYYDYYFQRNYHWKSYAIPNTFKFLIPRPDLTVFLSDSPENIFERKQDISVDEIRRQQAIIRAKSDLFNGFYEVENKFGFLDRTVSTIVNRINTK